ncbi:hypothetical protein [Roseibium alexandrii]|uniref:hypothetical protein n=1 Tax=Roseibium alexandrii TaxID=388408 RepID=UPI0001947739|nr:hypothetical protein [Roseibium alexandrii]
MTDAGAGFASSNDAVSSADVWQPATNTVAAKIAINLNSIPPNIEEIIDICAYFSSQDDLSIKEQTGVHRQPFEHPADMIG